MRKLALTAAVAVTTMIGVTGCSTSYSRDKTIEDLEEQGATTEQAECFVDAVEDAVGTDVLDENAGKDVDELPQEVIDAQNAAAIECGLVTE